MLNLLEAVEKMDNQLLSLSELIEEELEQKSTEDVKNSSFKSDERIEELFETSIKTKKANSFKNTNIFKIAPENKHRPLLVLAKRGNQQAKDFIKKEYECKVFTKEEIENFKTKL